MKKQIVIIIIMTMSCFSFIHSQTIKFPSDRKGKLYTCDGYTIKFNKLIIQKDSVICIQKGIKIKYASENVCRIDKKGNHIVVMTLVFAGVGAAAGAAVASAWDEDVLGKPKSYPIILYTSICAVGGFIFGAAWPKYKTVYTKNNFSYNISPQLYSLNNKIIPGFSIRINLSN